MFLKSPPVVFSSLVLLLPCSTRSLLSASAWRDFRLPFRTVSAKLSGADALKDRSFFTSSAAALHPSALIIRTLSGLVQKHPLQRFNLLLCLCCNALQYLTTVIPYENKGHPPSLEDLQVLTKSESFHSLSALIKFNRATHSLCSCLAVLQAMRDDSDKVPSLLTDYILKGELSSLSLFDCVASPSVINQRLWEKLKIHDRGLRSVYCIQHFLLLLCAFI